MLGAGWVGIGSDHGRRSFQGRSLWASRPDVAMKRICRCCCGCIESNVKHPALSSAGETGRSHVGGVRSPSASGLLLR
jgi:hypothetical protein